MTHDSPCLTELYRYGDIVKETHRREEKREGGLGNHSSLFKVQDIKLSDHSYLDADNLNAFSIGIFTGLFKDDKDQVWTVTLEPEEIRRMYNHSSVTKSFKDMRLHNHFRMRPCGVDVKRCHQLLSSLDLQGKARIENAD